jgi:hypothetical protein
MPAMSNESKPLSPALKHYLSAFDAHLQAKSDAERTVTRAVMVEALFEATGHTPRPLRLGPRAHTENMVAAQTRRRERERAED